MAKDCYGLLGVDETKQIVYVNYVNHDDEQPRYPVNRRSELRGYDLFSGKLIWRLPDTDDVFKNSPLAWEYSLSPDKAQIVCHERGNETLQVRAFPSCKLQYQIKIVEKDAADGLLAYYSDDGSMILVYTKSHVHFYDSSTGQKEYSLAIPELPIPKIPDEDIVRNDDKNNNAIVPVGNVVHTSNGNWATVNGPLQLSDDKRFFAIVGNEMRSVLVFHLPTKKLLAQLPFSGIPRFLGKDNTLLLVPEFHLPDTPVNNQLKRFMVSENGVTKIESSTPRSAIKGETLYCDKHHLVNNEIVHLSQSKPPFWAEWEWLPDTFKFKLAMMLYAKVRIDIYDPGSSTQLESHLLPLRNLFYAADLHRNWLSSNRQMLIINDGATLEIWKTTRPLVPWLILTASFAIGLWLAWPRRIKAEQLTASPQPNG